ncbi:MAG: aspartyl protease [Beggiatoa sp. IS2]|nr:MAG: aspartyl protease [Beggiatoa sp. IS2]
MAELSKRLGKTMIYLTWLFALGLLTLFFNMILDDQHNPNQQVTGQSSVAGVREVVLQRNRSGHYVANGQINGTPVLFFLDTGATMVAIPEHLANQLQLHKGMAMELNTANGVVTAYNTQLDTITLGTIELHKIRASINPSMSDDQVLLGMSFLKHLEFTQRSDTLVLRQYPSP